MGSKILWHVGIKVLRDDDVQRTIVVAINKIESAPPNMEYEREPN